MKYKYFRILEDDFKRRFIETASRPEGVNFLFYAHAIDDNVTLLLLDQDFEMYQYDNSTRTIVKME